MFQTSGAKDVYTATADKILWAGVSNQYFATILAPQDSSGQQVWAMPVNVPNADGHLHAGMPVTGTVALPPVSGIEIPVTAFVDDTHAGVYVVDDNVVKSAAVQDVKDDGNNAIVTGLTAGTTIVSDVDSANVGNGDRIDTGPEPGASPSAAHKHK